MADEILPMDAMEGGGPAPADGGQRPPPPPPPAAAPPSQPRDEGGRFAPKAQPEDGQQPQAQPRREPAGKPDTDQAYKRAIAERDEARAEAAKAAKRFEDMFAIARGEDPNAPKEEPNPLKPVLEKIESIDKRLQTNDEREQAQAVHRQVMQFVEADVGSFQQQHPDFGQAVQHYIGSRLREMAALGVTQEQAEVEMEREALEMLYASAQSNQSFATRLYGMAQARGYVPGNVVSFAPPAQPQAQPQIQPQPQPTYTRRSMGTGAGPAGGGVTGQQLLQMSEEDYNAFRETPEGKAAIRRALMGG